MTKVHIIQISDDPVSQKHCELSVPSWEAADIDVELWEASTPETIRERRAVRFPENGLKWDGRPYTPTERAVFYSHFDLWNKILDTGEAAFIAEQDCMVVDEFHPEVYNKRAMCVAVECWRPSQIVPAAGYWMTPGVARNLIHFVNTRQPTTIKYNCDYYIDWAVRISNGINTRGYWVLNQIALPYANCVHNRDDEIGTSIKHDPEEDQQ